MLGNQAPEEQSTLVPEASVAEAVDEGVDGAVEVVGADDDGVYVPAAVRETLTPVHRVLADRPEQETILTDH